MPGSWNTKCMLLISDTLYYADDSSLKELSHKFSRSLIWPILSRLAVFLQKKCHSLVGKVEDSEMMKDSLNEVLWDIIIWKLCDLE